MVRPDQVVLETIVASCNLQPVLGISALDLDEILDEAANVVPSAADRLAGLMIQVNAPDPDALGKHLAAIAQRTESPLVVQDYPVITGIPIATTDLVAAVQAVPQIVSVKSESSPSPPAVATLAASLDVPVFGGLGGTCLLDYLPLVNFEFQSGIALDLRKHSLVRRGLIASDAVRTPGAVPPSSMLKVLVQHLARTPGVELPDDVLAG